MFSVYFEYIGFVGLIYFLAKLVYSIYRNVFFYDQIVDFTSCGKWAIVTGGSDGIGLAYANELAQRGLNLVLISNAQRDLERAALTLSQKYLVKDKYQNKYEITHNILISFRKGQSQNNIRGLYSKRRVAL
jgi:17beta-estradiol 17-dehydrogenase / very-long-chain 3-oxoacyl-CoA reductase